MNDIAEETWQALDTARRHNCYFGMDVELELALRAVLSSGESTEYQQTLVHQGAHRFAITLDIIKGLIEDESASAISALARRTLASPFLPSDPAMNGIHISVNMCAGMVHDKFSYLARISDASLLDDKNAKEIIQKVLQRSSASISLR